MRQVGGLEGCLVIGLGNTLEDQVTQDQRVALDSLVTDEATHIHVIQKWLEELVSKITARCLMAFSEKYSPSSMSCWSFLYLRFLTCLSVTLAPSMFIII